MYTATKETFSLPPTNAAAKEAEETAHSRDGRPSLIDRLLTSLGIAPHTVHPYLELSRTI